MCGFFGELYEHTFERYPHKWSTHFYTLPVVTNNFTEFTGQKSLQTIDSIKSWIGESQ